MNQTKLKLGKMKNQELADWFGVSVNTIRNHKKDKLEELKLFADFKEVYGGVEITNIKEEYYSKQMSKSKQFIYDHFDENWNESGLDTCKNVADKIIDKYGKELSLKEATVYVYTLNAKNAFYGKAFGEAGTLGNCIYLWCKKDITPEGETILTEFTDEEQEIKKRLMTKYFATNEEKDIMIAEMVEIGEITKEEAYDLMTEYRGLNQKGFMSFLKELQDIIGSNVVKGTLIRKRIPEGDNNEVFMLEAENKK